MTAGITTIVAAGLAVLGTLLSPVLVQRVTARAKLQEFELARLHRAEDRESDQQRLAFVERRTAYTELNSQMRKFHRALLAYMHEVRSTTQTEAHLEKLNKARSTYLECYSGAQMLVSDQVLKAAGIANDGLGHAYGMARRLDRAGRSPEVASIHEEEEEEETVDSAFAYLEVVRQQIAHARDIMRDELGLNSIPISPPRLSSVA